MSLERSIKEPHGYIIRQNERMYEHRDSQATAMSVDWSGQYVLLAGRRHLALQKLEKDEDPLLRKYDRYSKHDVSAAEWAICQYSQEYCAIATSQLIEVVTWSSSDPTLIHSLRAHTRMVTDIDWHSKEPHLLASCSIDTFTHLWDLRDPRKPTLSLSAVCMSGATQVGFNRVSGNLLGTAHDGDLRIWDIRKGSCPIQYITAHLSRVHGINWSHKEETCLTTASQDGTVKYFDVNNSKRAYKIITTTSPVWRARFTPIGNGLVTVVVPHLGRGDNSLMLWSNNKQTAPVCSFVGHTDVILDFAWRPNRQSTSNEMELITWSRDQTLRLWRINDALMQHCEEDEGQSVQSENDWNGKSSSCSLQHEFSLLNRNIPHMQIEAMDSAKRYAIFKIVVSKYVIILQVNFPEDYPKPNVYPEFDFLEGTQIDDDHIALTITKALKNTALQRVKRGKSCLEQCIRNLVTALKKCVGNSNDKSSSALLLQSPRLEGALSGTLHDACVPYPRTSGVCFNNAGLLVHFSQNFLKKRISLRQHQQTGTPRALSAISGGFLGNVMGTQPVLYAHRDSTSSSFYDRISIGRASASSKNRRIQPSTLNIIVNIYDFQKILNLSKDFAKEFILQKFDLIDTCRHNRKIFEEQGRLDLYIWNLAELIASSNQPFESVWEMNFYKDPFKKIILEALIFHYAKNGDVQTAAILCCLFQNFFNHKDAKIIQKSPNESPYHTILPMDSANQYLALQIKQFRCNSRSNSLDFSDLKSFNFSDSSTMSSPVSMYSGSSNSLINKSKLLFFDSLKKLYAELLFAWGFYIEKTSILKHLSLPQDQPQKCVEFAIECSTCNRVNRTTSCMYCRKIVLYCTLCRLPVKGSASACLLCGHGGHTNHMDTWFQNNSVCASGCGCSCIIQTSTLLQRMV